MAGNYAGVALPGQTVTVYTAPEQRPGPVRSYSGRDHVGDRMVGRDAPGRPVEGRRGGLQRGPDDRRVGLEPGRADYSAKIRLLSVSPTQVAWGGTIHLVGQLYDGYLPLGGALVRLRYGEGKAQTTYGVKEHVGGTGRFTTTYTFGQGVARVHRRYWFELASLPTGNYPFAPARSRRVTVAVGGHPHPHHHKKHKKHKKHGGTGGTATTKSSDPRPVGWSTMTATLSGNRFRALTVGYNRSAAVNEH